MSLEVADAILVFSQTYTFSAIFILGLFTRFRSLAIAATSLLLFTTAYNFCLKEIWHIPLPPSLNKAGYAFPSGHMHASVVFYGTFIAAFLRQYLWLVGLLALMLVGIGCALVVRGYHYPADIVGATGFGCISIFAARILNATRHFVQRLWALPLLALVMASILDVLFLRQIPAQNFVLGALGGLVLLVLISFVLNERTTHHQTYKPGPAAKAE